MCILFFSLFANGNSHLDCKNFDESKYAYLTACGTERYINEGYPEYKTFTYYQKIETIKDAVNEDAINDNFIVFFLEEIAYYYGGIPFRINNSWVNLFLKKVNDKKLIPYIKSYHKPRDTKEEFQPWLLPFHEKFKEAIMKKDLIKDENTLRFLTLEYFNFRDEKARTFLLEKEYEHLISEFNKFDYDFINLKEAIEGPISDIAALFIFGEGEYLIDLPSNLIKSWAEVTHQKTKNPKVEIFAKKWIENMILWEDEENRIRAPFWLRSNEDFKEKVLYKDLFTDEKELKKVTLAYLNLYRRYVAPASFYDLFNEAKNNWDGNNKEGLIDEGMAQTLVELALKMAIGKKDFQNEVAARNYLGYILSNSYDDDINNKKLANFHIEDALLNWLKNCEIAINSNEFDADGNLITNLKVCSDRYFLGDDTLSNVIGIMFESGIKSFNNYDLSELLALYVYLNGENHPSLGIDNPPGKNPENIKNYPKQLREESLRKKDTRIFLYACMFMEDHWNLFNIDEVYQCYKDLKSIEVKSVDSKISQYDSVLLLERFDRLALIKENKISLNRNYNINDYFKKIYQEHNPKKIDMPKKFTAENNGKYALVIGNANYKERLLAPVNDAYAITKSLESLNYKVSMHTDLSFDKFQSAILDFSITAKNAEIAVVYFSGHAYQIGGQNFLLPVDIDMRAKKENAMFKSIELNKILRQNIPGNTRLIFLDACRNNPFNTKGLAPINVGLNTLVSYAAGAGSYALDGNQNLSPYTEALTNNLLKNKDIQVILRLVRKEVLEKTYNKQITEEYSNLTGDGEI